MNTYLPLTLKKGNEILRNYSHILLFRSTVVTTYIEIALCIGKITGEESAVHIRRYIQYKIRL